MCINELIPHRVRTIKPPDNFIANRRNSPTFIMPGRNKQSDEISDADSAALAKIAKEGESKNGVDAQIKAVDKELAELEKDHIAPAKEKLQQAQDSFKGALHTEGRLGEDWR